MLEDVMFLVLPIKDEIGNTCHEHALGCCEMVAEEVASSDS